MANRWSPSQYERFSNHRLRPALELLDRVPLERVEAIFDLGCGTGVLVPFFAERWPGARVVGVDNSAEMLEKARLALAESADPLTDVTWEQADLGRWSPATPASLLYSNAALHWIEDHGSLFPRLVESLEPGGCVAVQMPLSFDLDSHKLLRRTLRDGAVGGGSLGPDSLEQAVSRRWVHEAEFYYDLLIDRVDSLDIWETEYLQVLRGEDAVFEWVSGTALRPVISGLTQVEWDRFSEVYRSRLRERYPMRRDGTTLFRFRRFFLVATVES